MNILFITSAKIDNLSNPGIYTDLIVSFIEKGHRVFVICEKSNNKQAKKERISEFCTVLRKSSSSKNIVKKFGKLLLFDNKIKVIIKKELNIEEFDISVMTTPPITYIKTLSYIKEHGIFTYLLLKDIFPQNAIDLGFISKKGISSYIYKYFRFKEIQLYDLVDKIGCMSEANKNFILLNNPKINHSKLEISPNAINPIRINRTKNSDIRLKHNIPENSVLYVFGGNLGKPQGIEFLISAFPKFSEIENVFLFISGEGSMFKHIENNLRINKYKNISLHPNMSKDEYYALLSTTDVGIVVLNHSFTIPNYPSRILPYMQASIPIIFAVDEVTDVSKDAEMHEYGKHCSSIDLDGFINLVLYYKDFNKRKFEGANAYSYLKSNFDVSIVNENIIKSYRSGKNV